MSRPGPAVVAEASVEPVRPPVTGVPEPTPRGRAAAALPAQVAVAHRKAHPRAEAGPAPAVLPPGDNGNETLRRAAAQPPASSGLTLGPYQEWIPRRLRPVETASQEDIVAGLVEIVAAEGPMHALRAYQLYTRAAGGQRVGKEMKHSFNRATSAAVRSRRLAQVRDDITGQIAKTLYIPGTPAVRVRERGPRMLTEIPRSEVAAVIDALGMRGGRSQVLKRAVLDAFGLTKLTENASDYLDECIGYRGS